jgi:uncharacterized membrane protein
MRKMLIAAALVALTGCEEEAPVANEAQNAAAAFKALPPPPKLGGVDLIKPILAGGAAPGWALAISPGRITFTDFSIGAGQETELYPVDPQVSDGTATWTTKTPEADRVTIVLTDKQCLAGEPEDSQPLTAEVAIGTRKLRGCAQPRPRNDTEAPANSTS